ncbi:MAG: hypothetical protein WEA09_10760 [Gemmatimonadota bacterium]
MTQLTQEAATAGFTPVAQHDFTHLIHLDRLRDRLIGLVAPTAHRVGLHTRPFFGNLIGGNALREGLKRGDLRYGAVVLRKGGA